jgi:hypothetical protein
MYSRLINKLPDKRPGAVPNKRPGKRPEWWVELINDRVNQFVYPFTKLFVYRLLTDLVNAWH